jgi:hypothetical protein
MISADKGGPSLCIEQNIWELVKVGMLLFYTYYINYDNHITYYVYLHCTM